MDWKQDLTLFLSYILIAPRSRTNSYTGSIFCLDVYNMEGNILDSQCSH